MSLPRLSIVVLTCNRREIVIGTVAKLLDQGQPWPIVVVDNGSTDGSADALASRFPGVRIVRCETNLGAAGRNHGVAAVRTPYVAFCDDDTCWDTRTLASAVAVLDAHRKVAVVNARIFVGAQGREDGTCTLMAGSPLPAEGLPGYRLLGFMAGASVMRVEAFQACGGYEPRLFIGGEESLLALDLAERGWAMIYCPEVVTWHYPSTLRDSARRHRLLARNAVWVALMRLPMADAWREAGRALHAMRIERAALAVAWEVLRGLPWALGRRRPVGGPVLRMYRQLAAEAAGPARQ